MKTISKAGISLVALLALAGCAASGKPPKNMDLMPRLENLFVPDHTHDSRGFPVDSSGVPLAGYKATGFDNTLIYDITATLSGYKSPGFDGTTGR